MRTLTDLTRKEIRTIAKQYSRTDLLLSARYFSKKYDISIATFYNLVEKSIIEHIVSIEEANMMKHKAETNAYNHSGNAAEEAKMRVDNHYAKLFDKRDEFILKKSEAKQIIFEYLDESVISLNDFCQRKFIDYELFFKTIIQTSVKKYINNSIYLKVLNKFLACYTEEIKNKFIVTLTNYRNNYKDSPVDLMDIYEELFNILKFSIY